jgi:hypothetical protein
MATTSLTAVFGLDSKGFQTELNQLGKKIRRTANLWGKFGLAAAGALFATFSRQALSLGSQLDATAAKLGLTTDLLQELGFAGEQFGIRQETTNMALQRFARRLGEAQQGTGELLPVIQQYGIALTDSNGRARTATEVLGDYAELLKHTRDPQERLRLAFKAFDSEGVSLVNVLKDGKQGLKEWGDQAREAGVVLEKETIAKLAAAENAINNFKKRITVAVGNIIVNFRTEEGIKLLSLQLAKAAATFLAKIVDAVTYPARLAYNAFTAAFDAAVANLRNGLLKALQATSIGLNRILPEKFEISIAGLERLKTTAADISDAITRAIADTEPAALATTIRTAYDSLIAEQKTVIAAQETAAAKSATQLNQSANYLDAAGKSAGAEIKAGAETLKEAGSEVAKKIGMAFNALSGEYLAGLETATIEEIIRRTRQQLRDTQNPALNPDFNSYGTRLNAASLQAQLTNALAELATRTEFQRNLGLLGLEGARRASADPIVFERLLRDFGPGSQEIQNQTLNQLRNLNETINRGIDVRPISAP